MYNALNVMRFVSGNSSHTHPGYVESDRITLKNVEYYVHAYHACADYPTCSDLSTQTQALNLAIFFRKHRDLPKMTQYLALAAMHCAERERVSEFDNKNKSLDVVVKDKQFALFYMSFGYSIFLGALIADTKSDAIFVPPQSMKDGDAKALAYVLGTKPSIKTLNLSHQFITDHGAIALADALRVHPGIQKVYLTGNQISREAEQVLKEVCSINTITLAMDNQRREFAPRPK